MSTGGIVAIYAHPDDETLVAGTLARATERGEPVTMVCATRGEVGEIAPGSDATPETLGEFRERELLNAMAIIGVDDVRFLGYRDSGMQGTDENKNPRNLKNADQRAVVDAMREILLERRPDVVLTWDESGGYGHPDHIAVHHAATQAFDEAAPSLPPQAALYYCIIPAEEFQQMLDEMRARGIDPPGFAADQEQADELPRVSANCVIDVDAHFERKMQALRAHRTQMAENNFFLMMPEDLQRRFFGREQYVRARPPAPAGVDLPDFVEGLAASR